MDRARNGEGNSNNVSKLSQLPCRKTNYLEGPLPCRMTSSLCINISCTVICALFNKAIEGMSLFYFSTLSPETEAYNTWCWNSVGNHRDVCADFFFFEAKGPFLVLTTHSQCLIHTPYPGDTQSSSVCADWSEVTSESNKQWCDRSPDLYWAPCWGIRST